MSIQPSEQRTLSPSCGTSDISNKYVRGILHPHEPTAVMNNAKDRQESTGTAENQGPDDDGRAGHEGGNASNATPTAERSKKHLEW
ncbi:hypothetical protein J7T55_005147 [Diaporthe amygdali]|uniref:uncharacterized protein n=1 Tax=Phomopsis amygdali TaxID=1214568 RepID=UPI0022FE75C3|nr:uncharacterized protein J7T55_005147 [Diaporthe amygdali]KAJ0116201.1 hypothetical protein J7T55_005147 [Diaporthe amygdali]